VSAGTDWIAAVSPRGQLRLPDPPHDATTIAMNRRTRTGTTHRLELGGGISCWLDGDQQGGDGNLNWIATQMCTRLSDGALSGGVFAGPDDAPFVCGLVLFTGTGLNGPRGLSEPQLRRVVDAYAAASIDEPCGGLPVDATPVNAPPVDLPAGILAEVTRPPLTAG
jgi:hypothetical protein